MNIASNRHSIYLRLLDSVRGLVNKCLILIASLNIRVFFLNLLEN